MTTKEYNRVVHQVADALYCFALRYCNMSAAAEDAVQDVFAVLWERRDEVNAEGARGWLVRTLYRRLVDQHRRNEQERQYGSNAALETKEGYLQHESFELHDAVSEALAQLSEQQRTLVLLHDLEGFSYAEMAELTGLSEQQVGVYLWRARKTLKQKLDNYR